MSKVLLSLSNEGRHLTFHCFAVAALMMGFFIIYSASDMGPFQPLLVSAGIYLGLFASLMELLYWLAAIVRLAAGMWAK